MKQGIRVVVNTPLAIVVSVIAVCVTASWTFLVYTGKIPAKLPSWSVPTSACGGLVVGLLIPLVRYLREHGITFALNGVPSDPIPDTKKDGEP